MPGQGQPAPQPRNRHSRARSACLRDRCRAAIASPWSARPKDSSAQASSRLRDALNHAMVLNDRRARLSRDRRRIGTFWLVIRLGLLGTERARAAGQDGRGSACGLRATPAHAAGRHGARGMYRIAPAHPRDRWRHRRPARRRRAAAGAPATCHDRGHPLRPTRRGRYAARPRPGSLVTPVTAQEERSRP